MENLEIKKGIFCEIELLPHSDINIYTKLFGMFGTYDEARDFARHYEDKVLDSYLVHHVSIYEDDYIQVGERVFMQRDVEPIDEN